MAETLLGSQTGALRVPGRLQTGRRVPVPEAAIPPPTRSLELPFLLPPAGPQYPLIFLCFSFLKSWRECCLQLIRGLSSYGWVVVVHTAHLIFF